MTLGYLRAQGGQVSRREGAYDLTWPDGEVVPNVVFSGPDAERAPGARLLTLQDPRVRGLAMRLPHLAEGQAIACLRLPGIPRSVVGWWSLWRIEVYTPDWNRQRVMPLFLHEDSRILAPTARRVWEQLLAEEIVMGAAPGSATDPVVITGTCPWNAEAYRSSWAAAESTGRVLYEELLQANRARLDREREKGSIASPPGGGSSSASACRRCVAIVWCCWSKRRSPGVRRWRVKRWSPRDGALLLLRVEGEGE